VNLYNGPDGGLYVVDMYRGIIQHRIYLTTYLRNQIQQRGLDAPVGLGRIWRIVPVRTPPGPRPRLDKASSRVLVETLTHREAWWRDTAQRLLVERQDRSVVPTLWLLAHNNSSKLGRLHALWTLEGLDAVDWSLVQTALNDADVDVAVTGARLAERFFGRDTARTVKSIQSRIAAGEPAFLRQAALSLGAGPAESVDGPLQELALRHGALPFMADALVSSLAGRELPALRNLAGGGAGARAVSASLSAAILQSKDAAQIDALFALLDPKTPPWLLDAILDGIDRFIPGEGARKRTAFVPAEPRPLLAFAKTGGTRAARANEHLRFLRWRGQQIDSATALAALSEAERARYERGRGEFAVCAACHQPAGEGMAGLAPPLVGSPFVTGSANATIRIVLQGKTSGETTMPPLGALDDEQIASILTYVRRSWGHESSTVTSAQVQAVRSETRLREEPWTELELGALN
jgi:mono/diheme cytochrome c family protein